MSEVWEYVTVMSNLVLLLPAYNVFMCKMYTETAVFIIGIVSSLLYHVCRSYDMCVVPVETLNFVDVLFASIIFVVLGLCCAKVIYPLAEHVRSIILLVAFSISGLWMHVNGGTVVGAHVSAGGVYLAAIFMIAIAGVIYTQRQAHREAVQRAPHAYYMPIASTTRIGQRVTSSYSPDDFAAMEHEMVYSHRVTSIYLNAKHASHKVFYNKWFIGGVGCMIAGFVTFEFVQPLYPQYYTRIHSMWHILIGIGMFMVLIPISAWIQLMQPHSEDSRLLTAKQVYGDTLRR